MQAIHNRLPCGSVTSQPLDRMASRNPFRRENGLLSPQVTGQTSLSTAAPSFHSQVRVKLASKLSESHLSLRILTHLLQSRRNNLIERLFYLNLMIYPRHTHQAPLQARGRPRSSSAPSGLSNRPLLAYHRWSPLRRPALVIVASIRLLQGILRYPDTQLAT
jgi:hypothetical protein